MPNAGYADRKPLDPLKFRDPDTTADGRQRAVVTLTHLKTLWFNTGSLCNITCRNCYMDSSPKNDDLAYIGLDEVRGYLDEIARTKLPVEEIGFTGGEPFMNPGLPTMIEDSLERGFRVLVLTNAMKPMGHKRADLLRIKQAHGGRLTLRVSIDHHTRAKHEDIRGPKTWEPVLEGLRWLAENGFKISVAGRACWGESDAEARRGYAELFAREKIPIDTGDSASLVIFPEMDAKEDVPEITTACWDILGIKPATVMCATSRMVIRRKGAAGPTVVPCTLLPYDPAFEMGPSLSNAAKTVKLNHPHC
ncbi:MAG: radical SAM protein, partial [Rhodospirillales bacterium]